MNDRKEWRERVRDIRATSAIWWWWWWLLWEFFTSALVTRTFLSILADFNNTVVWMVSTRPLHYFEILFIIIISSSSSSRSSSSCNRSSMLLQVSFWRCPRGVMVKAIDCGIVVREFALLRSLSGKYPWERYDPVYPPSYGLNSTTTVLLGEWLWH